MALVGGGWNTSNTKIKGGLPASINGQMTTTKKTRTPQTNERIFPVWGKHIPPTSSEDEPTRSNTESQKELGPGSGVCLSNTELSGPPGRRGNTYQRSRANGEGIKKQNRRKKSCWRN